MKSLLRLSFLLFFFLNLSAQQNKNIVRDKLIDFHSTPKETAYLHLNKSLLLQGEQLGFSAYVINQNNFKPSKETTNLYVQVKDSRNKVIKEKMLLVENGTAASTFNIDSTFTGGSYSIIAYTNWMRNFDQQYFFNEKIQVIKSDADNIKKLLTKMQNIDAQFLPESGHLLEDRQNNLGIIIKDSLGYGLSNANVRILNQDNKLMGHTRLNQFGIGKISFIPDSTEEYTAIINFKGREFTQPVLSKVEKRGVVISTNNTEDELEIFLNTNQETSELLEGKTFILAVQSPKGVITYEAKFESETSVLVSIPYSELKPGINILTLFNHDQKAIAERLVFNHQNLPVARLEDHLIANRKDSLQVSLPTGKLADSTFLSVSVLPENSISDKRNHNILSYLMLQPHLRGSIEDASWYFKDMDKNKKDQLDNLLLTQGWSSYNWRDIFQDREYHHHFERYIDLKAEINNDRDKDRKFLIHASPTNPPTFVEVPEGKDAFIFEGIKPVEGEDLFISRVKNNDKLVPAGLSVQFFPNRIKGFDRELKGLEPRSAFYSAKPDPVFFQFNDFGKGLEQLDEVLVETKVDKELDRERKISNAPWIKADVIKQDDIDLYRYLSDYLISKGFFVTETPQEFTVLSSLSMGTGSLNFEGNGSPVTLYLDGLPMFDTNIFYLYPLDKIDYIEMNKTGMGQGLMGSAGVIKIYSKFDAISENKSTRNRLQKFEFPVSYAVNKEYYVPKYSNTRDEFFQQYGVIDWKSGLVAGENEDVSISFKKPKVDFKMIIEGFTAGGDLIYDVKSISVQQ